MLPYEVMLREQADTIAEFFIRVTGAEMARAVDLPDVADAFSDVDLCLGHFHEDGERSPALLLVYIDRRCQAVIAEERRTGTDGSGQASERLCRTSMLSHVQYHVSSVARCYREVLRSTGTGRCLWYCHRVHQEVSKVRHDVLGGVRRSGVRPLPLSTTEMVCEMTGDRVGPAAAIETARGLGLLEVQV